jgi:hypothetical protein
MWTWSAPNRSRALHKRQLHFAAMDADLRPFGAGGEAAWFGPDVLATIVEERLPGRRDAKIEHGVHDAEFIKAADAVRLHVDADAKRLQRAHALEHVRFDARALEFQRGHEPADAAPNDERLHVSPFRRSFQTRENMPIAGQRKERARISSGSIYAGVVEGTIVQPCGMPRPKRHPPFHRVSRPAEPP